LTLVLDASVAVKWFLPPVDEELVAEAVGLLRLHGAGRIQFVVPDLFWLEFANTARKAVRQKRWDHSAATAAISQVIAYRFPTVQGNRLVQYAFETALTHNTSIYDGIYVALAHELSCDLLTADLRLVNALGSRFPVRWLGSFSIG
jgi:predicted nucleic acid-binding protein